MTRKEFVAKCSEEKNIITSFTTLPAGKYNGKLIVSNNEPTLGFRSVTPKGSDTTWKIPYVLMNLIGEDAKTYSNIEVSLTDPKILLSIEDKDLLSDFGALGTPQKSKSGSEYVRVEFTLQPQITTQQPTQQPTLQPTV